MTGSAYVVHLIWNYMCLIFFIGQKTHTKYVQIVFELTFSLYIFFYLNLNTWKVSTTIFVAFFNFSIFNDFFVLLCHRQFEW